MGKYGVNKTSLRKPKKTMAFTMLYHNGHNDILRGTTWRAAGPVADAQSYQRIVSR